jgi:hypothetical protein
MKLNLTACYMAMSSIVLLVAVFRINQLEKLIGASVDKRIPGILSSHSSFATCVWVRSEWMINEFIASHLSHGIVDYTFFVDDPSSDLVMAVESNYTNMGLPIRFKPKSDRQSDLWGCVTDHVFRPTIGSVLLTDSDTFMFPMHDRFDKLAVWTGTHTHCTSFNTFDFTDSGDSDERYPNSVISSHRQSVKGRYMGPTMHFLGATVDDRIQFLRRIRRKVNCTKSILYGSARYVDITGERVTHKDTRLYDQKERYHVNKF